MSKPNKVIILTGVPGVGKTTVSHALAKRMGIPCINISALIEKEGLNLGDEEEIGISIADIERLKKEITKIIEDYDDLMIVEGHYAYDLIPKQYVSRVFVLRRAPWKLKEELFARGYSKEKVIENVEAELLNICFVEAIEVLGLELVCEIDTSDKIPENVVEEIYNILRGNVECRRGIIDWLGKKEVIGLLENQGNVYRG
jgi:adenylate kinase